MTIKNYLEIEKRLHQCGIFEHDDALCDVTGPCHFCGKIVAWKHYCFGCKDFICDNCDICPDALYPCGPHDVSKHHPLGDGFKEGESDVKS